MIDPILFPLHYVKTIGGAVFFSTDIQEGLNGFEVRSANWQDSRRRFNASPGIKNQEHVRLVRAFHMACMGAEIGFLLRDWSDYSVTETQDFILNGGVATTAYEQGVSQAVGAPTLTATVFQLQKLYHNGYRPHRRTIRRPQSGTVTLYNPSTFALIGSGYSIDYDTGLVTFDVAPGFAPNWRGNFYVPVRFESDEVEWSLFRFNASTKKGVGEHPDVVLVEDREI